VRVLIIHNYPGDYAAGGEGNVFEDEARLLREHGHGVRQFKCTNAEIMQAGPFKKIKAFIDAPWSKLGYQIILEEIEKIKPDIMHVHNFFFILSPSIFRAAKDAGVPTVATLHNYRLISPCSQLMRKGKVCEICLNKNPWRIMLYRCYRKSFLANLLRYRIYYSGKKKHGWIDDIDAFIALTKFGKEKYIEGGLPANRIHVKPNFMADPLNGRQVPQCGCGAIFVGRLSIEKGVGTLLKAWQDIDYPLTIVGDGPLRQQLEKSAPDNVRFVGFKSHQEVLALIVNSAFMIFPSECYEGFPLSLLEAMAIGKSVIASDLGPRREIVEDGVNGLLFEAGNIKELKNKIEFAIENTSLMQEMGQKARELYLKLYTPERNYKQLMSIYDKVLSID